MAPRLTIAGREIGSDRPPFLVAEMSGNHNGELDRGLALLEAAKDAGADAVKLQTYTEDTITIDFDGPGFVIEDGLWQGRRLYDLYREAHTPWEWHEALFDRARNLGLICFSAPFDFTAVDFLASLGAPAYKIASFELVDLPLIEKAAATGAPLILSTGMAGLADIAEAVTTARGAGCESLALLHCTSGYPTPVAESHVRTVPHLADAFDTVVGISDHTEGLGASVAAVALGAAIVEKHFTLSRADGGPDAAFSLEPAEFKQLADACRAAWESLGRVTYQQRQSEAGNAALRRSLYVVQDMHAGDTFTADNLRSIRPGHGLPPKNYHVLIGRKVVRDITRGTPASWDLVG